MTVLNLKEWMCDLILFQIMVVLVLLPSNYGDLIKNNCITFVEF